MGSDPVSDTQILSTLLNRGYDWRVRPPGTNLSIPGDHGPVVVYVNMLIRSISKIDDVNMEYSAQLTFRETWVDGRLAYGLPRDGKPDHIILTAGQQIWMPDSFFQNEKMARKHEIDKPNVLIRVHKDGLILYSVRISLVLSCPMHLQYYPMDVQTCLIDLASYAYTDSDIEYRWKQQDPVQLKDGLESSLPSFQLTNVSTTSCTSKTNTGTYSCLRTVLTLKRQFSYYLLQLYIPSTMLVIVSWNKNLFKFKKKNNCWHISFFLWVSFWLDRTAVPARVTLGVTTLLTMTTPNIRHQCQTATSQLQQSDRHLVRSRLADGRPSICAHCRGLTPPPPPPPPSSAATASAMLAQLQHRPSLTRTVHQHSNWDSEQPTDENYDDDCEDVWVRRKDAAAPTNVAMMNCAHPPSTPPSLSTKIGGGTSPGAMMLMMPPAAVGEKAALFGAEPAAAQVLHFELPIPLPELFTQKRE
ncbi:hypothetical protein niasHT_037879 [Heterodera trifolii]|uniref:Ig-like domain-containing protein n=1 Tax=Heterodera trifolii TaxID=157864 RepID=A0ABD2J4W2_9BILA